MYNFTVFDRFFYKSILQAENTFALKGNSVYYIRFRIDVVGYDPGLFGSNPQVRREVTSVPRDETMQVLQGCRLIEEGNSGS